MHLGSSREDIPVGRKNVRQQRSQSRQPTPLRLPAYARQREKTSDRCHVAAATGDFGAVLEQSTGAIQVGVTRAWTTKNAKCAKGAKGFGALSCLSRHPVTIAFQTLTPYYPLGFRARFNLEAGAFAAFVQAACGEPSTGSGTARSVGSASHVPGTAHSFYGLAISPALCRGRGPRPT